MGNYIEITAERIRMQALGIVVDCGSVHVRENTIRDIAASSTQSIASKGIENISDQTSQSVMLSPT